MKKSQFQVHPGLVAARAAAASGKLFCNQDTDNGEAARVGVDGHGRVVFVHFRCLLEECNCVGNWTIGEEADAVEVFYDREDITTPAG